MKQIITCPHCGGIVNPELAGPVLSGGSPEQSRRAEGPEVEMEPGVIRDFDAVEAETFNRVQITDLTGDPFHDWPLIAARFRYSLPDLVEVIYSDPKLSRYLKGQKSTEPQTPTAPSQLWQDLDAIRPRIAEIIRDGQFIYGHQSRIAEALGVPNQGSYRTRIQNVVSALQRTLIRNSTQTSTSSTASTNPSPAEPARKRRAA